MKSRHGELASGWRRTTFISFLLSLVSVDAFVVPTLIDSSASSLDRRQWTSRRMDRNKNMNEGSAFWAIPGSPPPSAPPPPTPQGQSLAEALRHNSGSRVESVVDANNFRRSDESSVGYGTNTNNNVEDDEDDEDDDRSAGVDSTSMRSRLADRFRRLTGSSGGTTSTTDTVGTPSTSPYGDDDLVNIQVKQGLYQIKSKEQHEAFLRAHPDKLVVLKFKASYCRACAAIEPDFLATKNEPMLTGLPIVWAECTASASNKNFFRRLGVLSLPTVHFYDGSNGLVENFACGPAKIPVLRQKLVEFLTRRIDPETRALKAWDIEGVPSDSSSSSSSTSGGSGGGPPFSSHVAGVPRKVREILMGEELITQEHLDYLRDGMPFFQDLTDDEFDILLSKARLQTYLPGDIIIRQGRPGKTFFVIKSGTVEMSIRSRFEDPISTPPSYLGAVVNQLSKFDYFGERACTTGEPYAASVRVLTKTRCFAFNAEDIPESSILSKKRRASRAVVDQLTSRYELPGDYKVAYPATAKDECILELLVRFKQVRQVVRCFEYVMSAKPLLGDQGEIARRSMLVSKLSNSQRQDFVDVFNMADVTKSGTINLLALRRFMEGARNRRTDDELVAIINKTNPSTDGSRLGKGITLNEFLGVMAEAEFYYLFTETFQELDKEKTGYVRAGDLDEVLEGVRYLITEDRKSIIDVEDQDVQVDYEQFAKMLLGAAL